MGLMTRVWNLLDSFAHPTIKDNLKSRIKTAGHGASSFKAVAEQCQRFKLEGWDMYPSDETLLDCMESLCMRLNNYVELESL